MITGRGFVMSWLRDNGPFWKLYNGQAGAENMLLQSCEPVNEFTGETLDAESSFQKFQQVLNYLSPGYYYVKAQNAGTDGKCNWSKTFRSTPFQITFQEANATPQQPQMNGVGMPGGPVDIEKMKGEILKQVRNEVTLENLQKEMKELKEKDTAFKAATIKFMNILEPLIRPAISGFISNVVPGQQPALMTGIPDTHHQRNYAPQPGEAAGGAPSGTETAEMDDPIFDAGMERLEKADPQVSKHIYMLGMIAEHNPQMLGGLLAMLENQYNAMGLPPVPQQ